MAKIRVNKTTNYTIMSNIFLRDKRLSLKAKGLLALMFSLPEEWNYSVDGLVYLCKEEESAVKSTLRELKECGYLVVDKKMPNETKSGRIEYEYNVYEEPIKQAMEKQGVENLPLEVQGVENPPQINTYILNKEEVNKEDKHTPPYNSPKSQGGQKGGKNSTTPTYGLEEFLQDNPQIRVDNYNGIIDDMNFAELTRRIRESSWLQQVEDFSFFCLKYNKIISGGYKDIEKKEKADKPQGQKREEEKPKRKWEYECTRC